VWNLLDLTTGWALDFFTGGDTVATVYGRLPFPGAAVPDTGSARAFCIFNELKDLPTTQGQVHAYRITYDQGADTVEFEADGRVVDRYEHVPDKITGFTAALGLMSEFDIVDGKSVSCHGQGVIGRWSPMRVATARGGREEGGVPATCPPDLRFPIGVNRVSGEGFEPGGQCRSSRARPLSCRRGARRRRRREVRLSCRL